jgi:prepilin signal peptidase PulO-like enzyme (type II secretory pathway)
VSGEQKFAAIWQTLAWCLLLCAVSPWSALTALNACIGALVIFASIHDWQRGRLPLGYTICGALLALAGYSWLAGTQAVIGCLAGFFSIKAWAVVGQKLYGEEVIGAGDSLLMLSLGGLLGPYLLAPALLLAVLGVYTFSRLVFNNGKIPFGPFLTQSSLLIKIVFEVINARV